MQFQWLSYPLKFNVFLVGIIFGAKLPRRFALTSRIIIQWLGGKTSRLVVESALFEKISWKEEWFHFGFDRLFRVPKIPFNSLRISQHICLFQLFFYFHCFVTFLENQVETCFGWTKTSRKVIPVILFKLNMEPDNATLEEEIPFSTPYSLGPPSSTRGVHIS